jgi:hypothetical protein
MKMAEEIAAHSPLVIQGAKKTLNYADEHSLSDCKKKKKITKQCLYLFSSFNVS